MSKGIGTPGNRETAYAVWKKYGGANIPQVLEELLREHSIKVSATTLYTWAGEGGWNRRMEQEEVERQDLLDTGGLSPAEQMIAALEDRRQAYESYFATLKKPDPQADYAYMGILNALSGARMKHQAYKSDVFFEFMQELIEWTRANDPAASSAIADVFDPFMSHMKEKYGNGRG